MCVSGGGGRVLNKVLNMEAVLRSPILTLNIPFFHRKVTVLYTVFYTSSLRKLGLLGGPSRPL